MFITCEFCVKDLFVFLPDLFLVVFKQPLTQVAHLLQCKRGLVLSRGTWETKLDQVYEKAELLATAATSHRDRNVLSPEIGTVSGENLQLCFLLSLTSASPQGHAALMWANTLSLPYVFVSAWLEAALANHFFTWWLLTSAVSRLDENVCKSQTRMAEYEGLMAASETKRGQVSNSSVSVIYEDRPAEWEGKNIAAWRPEAWITSRIIAQIGAGAKSKCAMTLNIKWTMYVCTQVNKRWTKTFQVPVF